MKTPWESYCYELDIARDIRKAAEDLEKAAHRKLQEAQETCRHKNMETGGMFFKRCKDCGWDDM